MPVYQLPGSLVLPHLMEWLGGNSQNAMDAAGESFFVVGVVRWKTGPGTTKTVSSAGGKLFFPIGNSTFSNAGTTIRAGIQDPSSGLEDNTFDVHDDLVGGTDTISANSILAVTMSSGSKSIAHGSVAVIGMEMTSRGGADSVGLRVGGSASGPFAAGNFPYCTRDVGSGPTKFQATMPVLILADDGTVGWIAPVPLTHHMWANPLAINYHVDSTPDEYAILVTFPFDCAFDSYSFGMGFTSASATYEPLVYEDPEGTPSALPLTITPNDPIYTGQAYTGGAVGAPYVWSHGLQQVSEGQTLGFAVRPTTTNAVRLGYYDLGSSTFLPLKEPSIFPSVRIAARTNQSGPFVVVQEYYNPLFYVQLQSIGLAGGGVTFLSRPGSLLRR